MILADYGYICRFFPSTIVGLRLNHHGNRHFRLTMECLVFDNGALKDSPYKAGQVIDALLSDMDIGERGLEVKKGTNGRDQLPSHLRALFDVHKSVWRRIVQNSPAGVQDRFAGYMHEYLEGTMKQVYWRSRNQYPTFREALAMRRGSAGVSPLFALAE